MFSELFIDAVVFNWSEIPQYSYLRRIKSLAGIERVNFTKPVTFFAGETGCGKSTLLEAMAIAAGLNPEGGTKNYDFSTRETHSGLWKAIKLLRGVKREKWGFFLRAESLYNVATLEEEYAKSAHAASREYHARSHGEFFLEIARDNLQANELYFFDEPEAALSPQRQLSLMIEINEFARKGCQFFIVTHSPILLGLPGAQIFTLDRGRISRCSYEETASYQVTEMFINHRERVLAELLD